MVGDDQLDTVDVDELVGSLTDKSMIATDPRGRYALLETLRQFGAERLAVRGSTDQLRQRHAAYFADLAVAGHDGIQGPDQVSWLRRLDADWSNLRAAFEWAISRDEIDVAATIATHLVWVATWHGFSEPFTWVNAVADVPQAERHALWPSVLAGRAWTAFERGDLEAALDLGLLALSVEADHGPIVDDFAHFAIYSAAHFARDQELADRHLELAMENARRSGRLTLESVCGATYATFNLTAARPTEALAAARAARQVGEASANPNAISWAMGVEGSALNMLHEASAEEVLRRGLAIAQDSGSSLAEVVIQRDLALSLVRVGRLGEAVPLLEAGLRAIRRKGSWIYVGQLLPYVARLLLQAGAPEQAALLCGATRVSAAAGADSWARFVEALRPRLERALGVDRTEELLTTGESMPTERAVGLAEQALNEFVAQQ